MKKYFMSWEETFERLYNCLNSVEIKNSYLNRTAGSKIKSVYGVPKGGMIIAGFAGNYGEWISVTNPSVADIIIDDIVDSGRTKDKFTKYEIPFVALVEKEEFKSGSLGDWIVFPWEADKIDDIDDNIQRLIEWYKLDVSLTDFKQTINGVVEIYKDPKGGWS